MNNELRTGIAAAITVAAGYSACAVVFRIWPEAALQFMNGLFHGLDFRKLQVGSALFDFGSFAWAAAVLAAWAFGLGALFAWIYSLGADSGRNT